jgi:tetratricopeptide (TPR) repeat protein
MQNKFVQVVGIFLTVFYAAFILWLYANQPQTLSEIPSKATVTIGTYEIDAAKFNEGVRLFKSENYRAARDFFAQADPEKREARTQFYIAYSFYREGWGKVYNDDALFKQGLDATNQVIALNPDFRSDDADLKIKTPVELKIELEKGLEKGLDDFNPLKILRERK